MRGSVLLGIIITWVLGMICQMIGLYAPDVENGFYSLFPEKIVSLDFSALGYTFGQCFHTDFHDVGVFNFIVVMFSFLHVDMFDTLGTLIGVSAKAGMLDEEGIAFGVISYVVINLICGNRKQITPLMFVLAVLFVCKYIFL